MEPNDIVIMTKSDCIVLIADCMDRIKFWNVVINNTPLIYKPDHFMIKL